MGSGRWRCRHEVMTEVVGAVWRWVLTGTSGPPGGQYLEVTLPRGCSVQEIWLALEYHPNLPLIGVHLLGRGVVRATVRSGGEIVRRLTIFLGFGDEGCGARYWDPSL